MNEAVIISIPDWLLPLVAWVPLVYVALDLWKEILRKKTVKECGRLLDRIEEREQAAEVEKIEAKIQSIFKKGEQ